MWYKKAMDDSNYVLTLYSKYMQQCLSKFMTSEKPFMQSAQEVLDNTISSEDVNSFIADIFPVAISNLIKTVLVCQSEMFKSLKLDEALPDMKGNLTEIRKKVSKQNKSIGNSQLYKLIREALVHSDTAHPNFQITSPGTFSLKLKPKGQPEIQLSLTNNEMLMIVTVFNFNLNNSMYYFEESADLQNAIDKGFLTENNFDKYLTLSRNGKPVKFDEQQKDAFLNYFYSNNQLMKEVYSTGSANAELFLSRIPFQANEYNNFIGNFRAILYLMCLKEKATMNFTQFDDFFYKYIKSKNIPMREGVVVDPYVDIVCNLLMSTFGNLATTVDKTEFCQILKNGSCGIDEVNANHIRNSLAHGRFFINPKSEPTVEFYDGRNAEELTHIASFPIRRINKVLAKQIMAYDAQIPSGEQEQRN